MTRGARGQVADPGLTRIGEAYPGNPLRHTWPARESTQVGMVYVGRYPESAAALKGTWHALDTPPGLDACRPPGRSQPERVAVARVGERSTSGRRTHHSQCGGVSPLL